MPTRTTAKQRKRRTFSREQRLAASFLSVVILAALAVVLLSAARVQVTITPRPEFVATDVEVVIVGSGNPAAHEVPGRLIRVDGTASIHRVVGSSSVDASAALPPERARGTVTLMNDWTSDQPLVATTRLLSADGVLFRIERQVVVPAKGQLGDVAVTADAVGATGNIGPTRFSIPGLSSWLQQRIWAESTAPMSGGQGSAGGEVVIVPMVSASDLEAAREEAIEQAKLDARRRAEAIAKEGEDAVPLDEQATVTTTGSVGDMRDHVAATATVTTTAILIAEGSLESRARAALEELATSSGREFLGMRDDRFRTRLVTQDPAAGRITIAVHAEGDVVLRPEYHSFDPHRIAGFTVEEVQTYIRSIPGVADVEVRLRPFWVHRVPTNIGAVDVEVRGVERGE